MYQAPGSVLSLGDTELRLFLSLSTDPFLDLSIAEGDLPSYNNIYQLPRFIMSFKFSHTAGSIRTTETQFQLPERKSGWLSPTQGDLPQLHQHLCRSPAREGAVLFHRELGISGVSQTCPEGSTILVSGMHLSEMIRKSEFQWLSQVRGYFFSYNKVWK